MRCSKPGCRKKADHLLLPTGLDLCMAHYREMRPYTVQKAAYDTFKDMLTPAEQRKWEAILDE